MRKIALIAAVALTLSEGEVRAAEVRLSDVIDVIGSVSEAAGPVEDALIVAFNLSNSYIIQTFSGKNGRFQLPPLPAGVYRIIAVKQGFAPAVATVTPSRHRGREVSLRLRAPSALSRDEKDAIWAARRAIPADILRDLNIVDESLDLASEGGGAPRFSGEMVSLTGIGEAGSTAAFAQTALGVRGRFGDGWTVAVSGAIRTVDDDSVVFPASAEPVAEASGVTMEINSGSDSSYRIASRRNSWLLEVDGGGRAADLQSHDIEWRRERANVRLRYVAHENLFERSPFGSERFELAAEGRLLSGERSDLDIAVRVGHESAVGGTMAVPLRTADVITVGSYEVVPSVTVHYGLTSRLSEQGQEFAPETGLLYRITPSTSVLVRGAFKIDDVESRSPYPSLVFLDQPWRLAPRYEYAVALTSGTSDAARFTAQASLAEIDSVLRIVFDERFEEFWDAFYLEPGDVYHAFSIAARRQLGETVALDLATRAGYASNDRTPEAGKHYLAGSIQSLYIPSGTAVNLAWRFIEQPSVESLLAMQESERINVRVAQSLGLPLGLRVLVGLDLARALNSSVVADGQEVGGYQKRLVGGVSLAF